jgi:hypothetical protein
MFRSAGDRPVVVVVSEVQVFNGQDRLSAAPASDRLTIPDRLCVGGPCALMLCAVAALLACSSRLVSRLAVVIA